MFFSFKVKFVVNLPCDVVKKKLSSRLGKIPKLGIIWPAHNKVMGEIKGNKLKLFWYDADRGVNHMDILYAKLLPSNKGCELVGRFDDSIGVKVFSFSCIVFLIFFILYFLSKLLFSSLFPLLFMLIIFLLLDNPFWSWRRHNRKKVVAFITKRLEDHILEKEINI